ncbi:hypothetical protein [Oceanibacterium hippocampi]|uniref:Uncharacterized protein n=1 Tax=Oceanibacterium hippocampi TaxID=745714 RepID=A0A1Y5S8E2_9PROT|nr:hypothetical protein [Oceanibacterium hippocampi]SLN32408.1 hypothetical protein OCH7691_01195 [Oceanibacterium hippocampi]
MRQTLKKFEAQVFNAEVARLVASGRHHRELIDDWAKSHFIQILARDLDHASRKAESMFPGDRGYVINTVIPVSD